ncbi:hypothetical protein [Apis mellifera associated microvirus 47]|nr:hypothetical protein [Apis mellifera associated microvirus 47]
MLDDQGREIPDDTPIVISIRGQRVSQFDQVRAYIRNELSRQAEGMQMETFEDANDFDVEDDMFPVSPHEYSKDTEEADREALQAELERQRRAKAASSGKPPSGNPDGGAGSEGSSPSPSEPEVQ